MSAGKRAHPAWVASTLQSAESRLPSMQPACLGISPCLWEAMTMQLAPMKHIFASEGC